VNGQIARIELVGGKGKKRDDSIYVDGPCCDNVRDPLILLPVSDTAFFSYERTGESSCSDLSRACRLCGLADLWRLGSLAGNRPGYGYQLVLLSADRGFSAMDASMARALHNAAYYQPASSTRN
jgi:hypothetical protein